jgi:hypothetical protein
MNVSVRSCLTAGVAAAVVSAVVAAPMTNPKPMTTPSPAIVLSAAIEPILRPVNAAAAAAVGLVSPHPAAARANVSSAAVASAAASRGDYIIGAYNAIEPWVAYGFEWADWALSFIPGVWWVAPAIDLAYFTAEPIVQSLVYSFAHLIDGQFSLIGPTLQAGVQDSVNNFITYGLAWVSALVPLPPLPPLPPFPGASVASGAAASRAVARSTASIAAQAANSTDAAVTATAAGAATVARPASRRSLQAARPTAAIAQPVSATADAIVPAAVESVSGSPEVITPKVTTQVRARKAVGPADSSSRGNRMKRQAD